MYQGFWATLVRPIVGLSPMDGVTDAPMRFITAKYGGPDVTYTEFVSAEGIRAGASRLLRDFKYDEMERPVVAQLFGKDPEAFFEAAKKVVELGFDGVDINMGCPSKNVAGRGAGAGLIGNQELAGKIIGLVKDAVSQCHSVTGKPISVSVKTRIGTNGPDEAWWKFLASQGLAVVAMHGRTFKQMYQGRADWVAIGEAAKVIRSDETIFLGNGDVEDIAHGSFLSAHFGTDGVLIGRAAMGNPWVFKANGEWQMANGMKEKLAIAIEHARKFEECFPEDRFFIMRKHLAWYCRGFENASELRQKLVQTNSADEVEKVLFPEVSS